MPQAAPRAATDPADLASPAEMAAMTGLEIMRAILEGRLAGAPIAATLGFTLDAVEDGRVAFRGAPGFAHANPMGTTHGGWYGTLLDSAMACAILTRVPRGMSYTTLEYKVNVVRPLPAGTEILCEGVASHVGRRTGVATGEMRGAEDGRLYATGSTTCIMLDG
jgi:uncharacterized protein (TIGR00369 family)